MWRPHDKARLETGLFDHFSIKIMGRDWEHLDKDTKDKKDKDMKERSDPALETASPSLGGL